jgi:5'-nucleotidase (lipoprotein e(P4) family)
MFSRLFLSFMTSLLLVGCQQGPAPYDQLDAMLWSQTSIEHELIYQQVYAQAERQLPAALADPQWDALPGPSRDLQGLPPAVIVDVDETLLSNLALSARDIRANRTFDYARWNRWVEQRMAPALPGALQFARAAQAQGVTLLYITNREHSRAQATADNLRRAGFPLQNIEQVLAAGTPQGGCQRSGYDKSCRRAWVGRQYRVLMQIGDAFGDFIEASPTDLTQQRQAAAPYLGWLGIRWFLLPNPTYGDWYSAPYHGDETLPAAEKRRLKHQALITQED